jgi:ABC-2 type transport system permease protein
MSEGRTEASDAAVAVVSTGFSGVLRDTGSYLFPPALSFRTVSSRPEPAPEEAAATSTTAAILTVILPGLAVMGILFVAQSASRDVVCDRERGLVRHLLTTPTTAADYLLGKTLSVLLATILAFAIFIVLGLAAGVAWGSPLPTLLLVVATSLAVTGALLLITSAVRTERQGDAVTTVVVVVWSLLGGAFIPVSQLPAALLPLARTTAVYWSTDGFARLAAGEATAAIVPNLAILVAAGLLFLAAGNLLLHRRLTGGSR